MARPASFNKRDNEKKKLSKRLEKQQKKEIRKSAGKTGLDDMIAYVDENGMITDTPPEIKKKDEVNIEDIAISTPKKEEVEEPAVKRGRVEHFNDSKGYGFIKNVSNTDKYFFHISESEDDIVEGNMVTFELQQGNKGMNAVNIKLEK